jgi:hypothetical protein
MKPTIVFVRVVNKPEYHHGEDRLLASYLKYKPEMEHDVVIVDHHGTSADDLPGAAHLPFSGNGWDCGIWKFAGQNIEAELLVCFNSSTFITGHGWLEHFVKAVETHGDGLYGPLASYEIVPHIRTPCMAFQPHVVASYPQEVNCREDTYRFEVFGYPDGTPNFTQWCRGQGFQARAVYWSGCHDQPQWRDPENIFRRGDQSNLIVKDRHAEAYEISDVSGKLVLERLADGK